MRPHHAVGLGVLIISLAALGAWVIACSQGDPAIPGADAQDAGGDAALCRVCPNLTPDACPSPMPSWTNQIEPLMHRDCAPCHFEGGVATVNPLYDYESYTRVHFQLTTMLQFVGNCCMPPLDGAALTNQDRAALLAWLICGAPDN
jgi:hypothetical protein